MVIAELPFFVLLILTILPIVIAILFFTRIMDLVKTLMAKHKQHESISLTEFGDVLVLLVFVVAIIQVVFYLIGNQPSGFDIFTYLVTDTLPTVWYILMIYGILVNLAILFGRSGKA
jgi:phosphatidylglycerophosphate synthase